MLSHLKILLSVGQVPEIVLSELVISKAVWPCQCIFPLQDELSRALCLTNCSCIETLVAWVSLHSTTLCICILSAHSQGMQLGCH